MTYAAHVVRSLGQFATRATFSPMTNDPLYTLADRRTDEENSGGPQLHFDRHVAGWWIPLPISFCAHDGNAILAICMKTSFSFAMEL